jgi:hypothetical protein
VRVMFGKTTESSTGTSSTVCIGFSISGTNSPSATYVV